MSHSYDEKRKFIPSIRKVYKIHIFFETKVSEKITREEHEAKNGFYKKEAKNKRIPKEKTTIFCVAQSKNHADIELIMAKKFRKKAGFQHFNRKRWKLCFQRSFQNRDSLLQIYYNTTGTIFQGKSTNIFSFLWQLSKIMSLILCQLMYIPEFGLCIRH